MTQELTDPVFSINDKKKTKACQVVSLTRELFSANA